jgi:hypothetical protein
MAIRLLDTLLLAAVTTKPAMGVAAGAMRARFGVDPQKEFSAAQTQIVIAGRRSN